MGYKNEQSYKARTLLRFSFHSLQNPPLVANAPLESGIEACTYSSAQHGSVRRPRRAPPMLFMAAKARNNHLRLRLTWIRPPYRVCFSAALRGGKKSWSTYLGLYLTWISLPSQTCIKAALHHGKYLFKHLCLTWIWSPFRAWFSATLHGWKKNLKHLHGVLLNMDQSTVSDVCLRCSSGRKNNLKPFHSRVNSECFQHESPPSSSLFAVEKESWITYLWLF